MYEQRFNPFAANLEIVKGYFKSGKVLTLGILYVIAASFSFVSTIAAYDTYYEMLKSTEYAGAMSNSITRNGFYFVAAFGSLWLLLTAVGFFIVFAKSRSTAPDSSPRGGFNLLKVLAVFELIAAIIVMIVLLAVAVVCIVGSSSVISILRTYYDISYIDSSSVQIIAVILALAAVIYAFFLMFWAINHLRFLNSARKSMNSVDLYRGGASAYGFVNIIMAVFTLLTLVGSLFTIGLVGVASNVLNLLIYIFTAALAFGYSGYIKGQKQSYNNLPYGGAPNNFGGPAPSSQIPYASAPVPPQPTAPSYDQPPYKAPAPEAPYYKAPSDEAPVDDQTRPAKFCGNCGAPVNSDDPFCGNCGNKL